MSYTSINKKDYNIILISTTSKHSTPIMRLPDKFLNEQKALNYLISDPNVAKEFLSYFDDSTTTIFADVEKKQGVSLFEVAKGICKNASIIEYKPNDVTLEAADIFLTNFFDNSLFNKRILVYGTGNLAFKMALRLLEKNNIVYICGRNFEKVMNICRTLKMISFSDSIFPYEKNNQIDAIVSFISGERILGEEYIDHMNNSSLLLDGGIGNFKEGLIQKANDKGITVARLDVRIADFVLANRLEENTYFFNTIYGSKILNNYKIVSGGILAEEGSLIVDQIKNPSKIIGIANGIGGLKNVNEYTEDEKRAIHTIEKEFL